VEAGRKPRTEDKKYCSACGKTGWHFREGYGYPWKCSICGAVEKQREKRDDDRSN
jgi:ribosomal protein L37AE/L43A